jgi:hypothetical protein
MRRVGVALLLLGLAMLFGGPAARAETLVPRTIITFYDSTIDKRWRDSTLHQMAELPLNHLGLVLEPHDINAVLPDLTGRADVRGILTWFPADAMSDPLGYIAWAERAVAEGRHYVMFGVSGFAADRDGRPTPDAAIDRFLGQIGLRDERVWSAFPYKAEPIRLDPEMIGYERPLAEVFPPFQVMRSTDPAATSYLTLRSAEEGYTADLVVIGPHGGYAAGGYAEFYNAETQRKRWIIDPFRFFRLAFATDDLPKPDTTTIVGRRIYYSQIDGDGWRNVTTIEERDPGTGTRRHRRSIDLLADRAIAPYPDLPVSVAPIAADLDPEWCGDPQAQDAARRVFALDQVEIGSHTYSHPLDWGFFENAGPEKEQPFLRFYPKCGQRAEAQGWARLFDLVRRDDDMGPLPDLELAGEGAHIGAYATPRSFATKPFDLEREITGAAAYIESFAPPGKRVALVQWSGNTLAFAEAIRQARLAGLPAINGGDTRFDPEDPSVGYVAPVGRYVDGEWQIYASASNENTYSEDWSDRYFGLKYLARTLQNTETPRRLKPFDLYYHVFSGDRQGSLNAVLEMLDLARRSEIAPLRTSAYARIGDGFFRTRIEHLADRVWRVRDRGGLATIRFDDADALAVDPARSTGVVGERWYQGSLYVALDPEDAAPVIALEAHRPGAPTAAMLRDSRWPISALVRTEDGLSFAAEGFGSGAMTWRVPIGLYHWTLRGEGIARDGDAMTDAEGRLALDLGPLTGERVTVALTRRGGPS